MVIEQIHEQKNFKIHQFTTTKIMVAVYNDGNLCLNQPFHGKTINEIIQYFNKQFELKLQEISE